MWHVHAPSYQHLAVQLALLMIFVVEEQANVVLRSALSGTSTLAPNCTYIPNIFYFVVWSEQEISFFIKAK